MDIVDASHFEVVKEYVKDTSTVFRLRNNKKTGFWSIEFQTPTIPGYDYKYFRGATFSAALRKAYEYAIQERETTPIIVGETSRNSSPLGEEVRQ